MQKIESIIELPMVYSATKWTKKSILLFIVFFFSGFSALIYQVVWQRLLTLHYGVGTVSITLIVSVYMLGLGVGALFGGYLAERINRRILLYASIELLIGFFGIVSLPLLHWIGSTTAGSSHLVALVYMFLFLSVPTFLMGMTLPLLIKIINSLLGDFFRSVSLLYFVNTLGAAIGTLGASYLFISFFGLDTAAYVASFLNLILAVIIFMAGKTPAEDRTIATHDKNDTVSRLPGIMAYLFVFITGFLAIGYEITWFRVIGVLVKASPYAFSSVLAVYLFGIATGSYGMNLFLRRVKIKNQKTIFFILQVMIALSVFMIFLGYYFLTRYTNFGTLTDISFATKLHPLFVVPSVASLESFFKGVYQLFDVFWWSAFFMFVPTVLMGASFPLITNLAMPANGKAGKVAGSVYFFNILGNVLGGLITGFLLLPWWGSETTLTYFIIVGVGFVFFVTHIGRVKLPVMARAMVFIGLVLIVVISFPQSGNLYKLMHRPMSFFNNSYDTYFEEGLDGVNITYKEDEKMITYINGLGHGLRPGYRFYYETLEALNYTSTIDHALIIGFGTGSMTEIVLRSPDIDTVTLIELNSTLMNNHRKIELFKDILDNPKLVTIIDDGRRYLLKSDNKFDFVAMDPLRTTTAYSNNIYSKEFFELTSNHMTGNGVLLIWTDEGQVLPKTVASIFPYVRQYNFFLIAGKQPLSRDITIASRILETFQDSLQNLILAAGENSFLGSEEYIMREYSKYPVNSDWKPSTEYYFGLNVKKRMFYRE